MSRCRNGSSVSFSTSPIAWVTSLCDSLLSPLLCAIQIAASANSWWFSIDSVLPPIGFSDAKVLPDSAYWVGDLGEFVLPYEAVRQADDPDAVLLDFLQTTFEGAASLADWDLDSMRRRHFPPGAK